MKLGAQLYSLRNFLETEQGTLDVFKAVKAMGYEAAQYSGKAIATMDDARLIRRAADEAEISLESTSFSAVEIMEDPGAVIEKMNAMGTTYTMVGIMPKEYRGSREDAESFIAKMEEPLKILRDAGKIMTYHNHDFEFKPYENGGCIMDVFVEKCADWTFMLDVCWAVHGGADPLKLMDAMGAKRLHQVHFKDMTGQYTEKGKPIFCPCGEGTVDLKSFYEKALSFGVQVGFVEQDNAATLEDPLGQMEASCKNLRKLMGKDG